MTQEQQFKRNIAYKLRIGDLLIGKPVMNGEKFSFIELGNKKVVRVNILGNIVDRYEAPDTGPEGKKYIFLTLDDGSGQIKLKTFGDDSDRFKEVVQGQTVVVIGILRNWNDETYITPEIIREVDPKYLLLRKLETESNSQISQTQKSSNLEEKEKVFAIKDKIIDLIKDAEGNGGIDTTEINSQLNSFSPEIVQQEIHRLLEEGIIFEPRPGKLRYLG